MRIVFCSTFSHQYLKPEISLVDDDGYSHPSSWVRVLAEELSSYDGIDLHIITFSSNFAFDQLIVKNNITFHLLSTGRNRSFFNFIKLSDKSTLWIQPIYKMLKTIKKLNPDIVHGHGTESCFSLAALLSGRRAVLSLQGIISLINKDYPKFKYRIVGFFEREVIKRVTNINVKSHMSSSFVTEIGHTGKQHFIEASIDKNFFNHHAPKSSNNIYFVGDLIERKGINEFVELFVKLRKKLVKVNAYIIGSYSPLVKKDILLKLNNNGIHDGFEITGQLNFLDIAQLYKSGGVFCLTSHTENSPNVVMEAMASGVPVVSTDVGDIKNIVQDGISGYVVRKKDVDHMMEKVFDLLSDVDKCFSFGSEGRKIALNRWHPDIIAKKHLKMYTYVVS